MKKETFPEARIAICKCKEGRKKFGVRFEKCENNWTATWAFPIKKEGSEKRENYDQTHITGLIKWGKDYPGCPYCGGIGFVICSCGGLNCKMNSNQSTFTCDWCGLTGELSGYTGDGFKAGADR